MRVRAFTQDDAHVFVSESQIADESLKMNDLILSIYEDFGFSDVRIKFSDRPDKRIGEDVVWDKAESALMAALKASGRPWTLNKGEGAFYGPKLEYVLRDAIGRDWQCGTVQVDLNLPGRLGAFYIDEHSNKVTPVMLHRAMNGLPNVGKSAQDVTHVRRISKYSGQPRKVTIDAEPLASDFGQDLENGFIGHIIANEYRHSPREGRMRHQPANALAFVDARTLDLEHCLALQQFGRLARKCRLARRDMPAQAVCQPGRFPIVQRERIVLVLNHNSGPNACAFREALAQIMRQGLRPKKYFIVTQAHLGAVAANCRQAQGRKEPIQIADRTAAHESERSIHESEQALECLQQPGTNMHFSR